MDFVAKNQKIAKRASHIQRGSNPLPSLHPALVFTLLPMLILIINTSVGPGSRETLEARTKSASAACRWQRVTRPVSRDKLTFLLKCLRSEH